MTSRKQISPACERNKIPILETLTKHFPTNCRIIEIASGTGEHANYFTAQRAGWFWQTSDTDPMAISSITAYSEEVGRENFPAPKEISTQDASWEIGVFDGAFCCNMIHISPWDSCIGLFKLLNKHVKPNGPLALYGPFLQKGIETAPSNLSFNSMLKERNPSWGIRDLDDVKQVAASYKFQFEAKYEMPANNLTVIFTRGEES